MNIFQDSLTKLQMLYSLSKKISIISSTKRASVYRTMLLEKMLEKILLHSHSILRLLSVIPEQFQELDVSLISSAARNIMETSNLYFHMSQRGLDADAIEFRISTLVLNEIFNEMDITKKLGISQTCMHAQINRLYYEQAAERFRMFPDFMQLSANEQAQVVSGRKAAFRIESPHILEEKVESAIYNLFSNSVHGLPLGLSSNSVNRTCAFHNFFRAEHLAVVSLQISRIYTAHVVKDYLNLRKQLYSLLTAEEKEQLKSYMCCNDLKDYIDDLRTEYEKNPFGG